MENKWLDQSEYPFAFNYFNVNGYKLHYIDEGKGEVLLCIHGTPTWSFDYRNLIKELRSHYRCIAIDHMGFGLSDKPESYDYSTINHAEALEKFIIEKELKNITLIVHDFGGPTGFSFAIKHPEKISRIVVFNSWLWSSENDPGFLKFKKVLKNPLLPFLYKQLNFSPRFILPASYGENKPGKKTLRQYTRPFANSKQRNGALAFARSLINDQQWFEALWNKKDTLSNKPVLFIWGMKDRAISPRNLEKFEQGFPNSKTIRLEKAGHFPQEEQPETVIAAISDFLKEKQSIMFQNT